MPKSKMGRQRQSRIKRLAAETIALGCVALDWKAAGLALGDLTEWLQEEGISLKALLGDKKYPRWDHALRALESCIKPGKSRIAISAHKFMTPSSPKRHKVDAFITEQYECDYYAQHLDEIPPPNTRARREYNLRQGVRRSHSQSISAE